MHFEQFDYNRVRNAVSDHYAIRNSLTERRAHTIKYHADVTALALFSIGCLIFFAPPSMEIAWWVAGAAIVAALLLFITGRFCSKMQSRLVFGWSAINERFGQILAFPVNADERTLFLEVILVLKNDDPDRTYAFIASAMETSLSQLTFIRDLARDFKVRYVPPTTIHVTPSEQ